MKNIFLIIGFTILIASALYAHKTNRECNSAVVTMRGGEQYTGRVLFAGENILVLWQSDEPYNASILNLHGKAVHISDVYQITIVNKSYFWLGLGLGSMIGLAAGSAVAGIITHEPDSVTSDHDLKVFATFGIIGVLCGGLIFGIKGAIEGIDDDYRIDGNIDAYSDCLPRLQQCATCFITPPPELEAYIKEQFGN